MATYRSTVGNLMTRLSTALKTDRHDLDELETEINSILDRIADLEQHVLDHADLTATYLRKLRDD